jgi:hypothetical protein
MLTQEELTMIGRALATDYQGSGISEVVQDAMSGLVQIWRVTFPETEGILVTQICETRRDKELYVWLMGGHNFYKIPQELWSTMQDFAEKMDCRWIRSQSIPAVARYLSRNTPLEIRYHTMIYEVK